MPRPSRWSAAQSVHSRRRRPVAAARHARRASRALGGLDPLVQRLDGVVVARPATARLGDDRAGVDARRRRRTASQPVTLTPYASASRGPCMPGNDGEQRGVGVDARGRRTRARNAAPTSFMKPGEHDEVGLVRRRRSSASAASQSLAGGVVRRPAATKVGTPARSARAEALDAVAVGADGDHLRRRTPGRRRRRAGPAGWCPSPETRTTRRAGAAVTPGSLDLAAPGCARAATRSSTSPPTSPPTPKAVIACTSTSKAYGADVDRIRPGPDRAARETAASSASRIPASTPPAQPRSSALLPPQRRAAALRPGRGDRGDDERERRSGRRSRPASGPSSGSAASSGNIGSGPSTHERRARPGCRRRRRSRARAGRSRRRRSAFGTSVASARCRRWCRRRPVCSRDITLIAVERSATSAARKATSETARKQPRTRRQVAPAARAPAGHAGRPDRGAAGADRDRGDDRSSGRAAATRARTRATDGAVCGVAARRRVTTATAT